MLVALFDSELLCSPPSNRATNCLACVGFVRQADMGDEYDIIEWPWELRNLANLYLGTFTWEPFLGNLYLKPLLGNL